MFFVMTLRLSDHKVLHNIASSFFSISLFKFLEFKELFHERLLDMRLVIANSALRASLAIYHLLLHDSGSQRANN